MMLLLEDHHHHAIHQALADIRSQLTSSSSSIGQTQPSVLAVADDDDDDGGVNDDEEEETSLEETLRKSKSWLSATSASGAGHADDISRMLNVSSTAVAAATVQQLEMLLQDARAEAEDCRSDACAWRQAVEGMREKNSSLQASCRLLTDRLDESRLLVQDSENQRWFLLKEWRRHTIALCAKFSAHVLRVRQKRALLRAFQGWMVAAKVGRSLKGCTNAVQRLYRNGVKMRALSAWMHRFMKRKVHSSARAKTQLESDRRLQSHRQEQFTRWTRAKLVQCHAFMLWRTLCTHASSRAHEIQAKLQLGKRRRLQDGFRSWHWHVRDCKRIRLDAQVCVCVLVSAYVRERESVCVSECVC
jgi:hypothetical protein